MTRNAQPVDSLGEWLLLLLPELSDVSCPCMSSDAKSCSLFPCIFLGLVFCHLPVAVILTPEFSWLSQNCPLLPLSPQLFPLTSTSSALHLSPLPKLFKVTQLLLALKSQVLKTHHCSISAYPLSLLTHFSAPLHILNCSHSGLASASKPNKLKYFFFPCLPSEPLPLSKALDSLRGHYGLSFVWILQMVLFEFAYLIM